MAGDGDWESGLDPVFVDTPMSPTDPPRTWGSLAAVAVAVIAVVGVTAAIAALLVSGSADEVAEPEPTPASTPEADRDGDRALTATIRASGATMRRFELRSDGRTLCVASGDGSLPDTCGSLAESAGTALVVAAGERAWCVAGRAPADGSAVEATFTDGTTAALDGFPVTGEQAVFAGCRADGVGLAALVAGRRQWGTAPGEGALIPATVFPEAPVLRVSVPDGWRLARIGPHHFVAPGPVKVPVAASLSGLCSDPQTAVLSAMAPDDVLFTAMALHPAEPFAPRAEPASFETTRRFEAPCLAELDLQVRASRFRDAGRDIEAVVVAGPLAPPSLVARAEALVEGLVVSAAPAGDGLAALVATDPVVVAAGDAVIAFGGVEQVTTSIFATDEHGGGVGWTGGVSTPTVGRLAATGARYDTEAGGWQPIADAPIPMAGGPGAAAVWTGNEVLAWSSAGGVDGVAYDPAANTWRAVAPPVRGSSLSLDVWVTAWTGEEVLVWGRIYGRLTSATEVFGAAYDPAADSWRPLAALAPVHAAVWTGDEVVAFGGATVFVYDPSVDRWRAHPGPVDPDTGEAAVVTDAWWDGNEVLAIDRTVSDQTRIGRLFVAGVPFETWRSEDFPPTTVTEIDAGLVHEGGLFAVAEIVDAATRTRAGWSAWRRNRGGVVESVPWPRDWDRCGATAVSLPGSVGFVDGVSCASGDPLVERFVVVEMVP